MLWVKKTNDMQDQYNRKIDYLRLSLTDRCNLHCKYCQPEVARHVAHEQILRYEEILRFCRVAVQLGIKKFKLTGGEPLVREGCAEFISELKKLEGVEQVTLTTNGTLLPRFASVLKQSGLDNVNISLDTTDAKRYAQLTGGSLDAVLAGLEAARAVGLPFKLNCVPLEGMDRQEILQLLQLAQKYNAPLRFIELMPLACNRALRDLAGVTIRNLLLQMDMQLVPDSKNYGNGPASYYRVSGHTMPVGFIEPLHQRFCHSCNRVRLTSVGFLKPCLYSDKGLDVARLLRGGATVAELAQAVRAAIFAKPQGHKFDVRPARFNMSQIGG